MISLYDIIEVSSGQLFGEPVSQIFTGFCVEAEKANDGELFVVLNTPRGDTHRFIETAIKSGASGVLCSKPPDCDTKDITVLLVKDTIQALLSWSHYILSKQGIQVIAVAGSAGKFTTIHTIKSVLSTKYKVFSASFDLPDKLLAVPFAVAQIKAEHEIALFRIDTDAPNQLAQIVSAIQPKVAVITAIHHDNLKNFGTIEAIASDIEKLVDTLSPNDLAVFNYDDDLVRGFSRSTRAHVVTVGVDNFGADIMAYNVVSGIDGTGFDLKSRGERYLAQWSPLLGKFQLYSVLSALAVGQNFDIDYKTALETLRDIETLPRRMHASIGKNDALIIDDSINANEESTLAAIHWLQDIGDQDQRLIFVLGSMDNLGEESLSSHRKVGKAAADIVDIFITQGAEAMAAARSALDNGFDSQHVHSTYSIYDTIQILRDHYQLSQNDIILIKGGKSSTLHHVTNALLKQPVSSDDLVDSKYTKTIHPTWVEVNTDAFAQNVRAVKAFIGDNVNLMAVVKADAYGHGAVACSQTALLNGAEYLAVGNLTEALDLRSVGISAPILTLSYVPEYGVRQAVQNDLTLTVYDLELARRFNQVAQNVGKKLKIHVKIDTGMGRLGVLPDEAIVLFRHLTTLEFLDVEGIYTHFSSADEDPKFTQNQIDTFKHVVRPLRASGFNFKYIHAANSAGIMRVEDKFFNMVRVGLALYGLNPVEGEKLPVELKPVLSWKSVVAQVKTLPKGHNVGYGNTYTTKEPTRVAVIPIGYADGLRRSPPWMEVLIHGKKVPIIGRVSMEKSVVDISGLESVSIGDEVVIIGSQEGQAITAEQIAKNLDTINYEIVCNVLARKPRL